MNRCKWKDGKFKGCDGYDKIHGDETPEDYGWCFCPFCGADIRKPEPVDPLIVRSGETWVAHWEGVDYLWMIPKPKQNDYDVYAITEESIKNKLIWKSFTGPKSDITELTDDIAKLRPMVRTSTHQTVVYEKLLYVQEDGAIDDRYVYHTVNGVFEDRRLATAKELEADK